MRMRRYIAAALLAALPAVAGPEGRPAWDQDVLGYFATWPVQDGGRVKPLDTCAGFKLLKFSGRRTVKTAAGRLTALEWLLDCLFYPEMAHDYPVFSVNSTEVIVAMGLQPQHRKRGRYAYRALEPGLDKLFELADRYARVPSKTRGALENQIVNLAQNVSEYEALASYTAFARQPFVLAPSEVLARLFEGRRQVGLADILREGPRLQDELLALKHNEETADAAAQKELKALGKLFHDLDAVRAFSNALALFPPATPEAGQWLTPADLVLASFAPDADVTTSLDLLGGFEELVRLRDDRPAFGAHLAEIHDAVAQAAASRGEYEHVALEVTYYKSKLLYRSLVLFLVCFVLVAVSWLFPRSRVMHGATVAALVAPTLLLVAGIALRCVIRGRPPVTTLYETILFTTATVVVLALVIEYLNRQRLALSLGAVLGVLGMLLAHKYEARDGTDTMPSMVAVLDTNFWLASHVTTIVIGYAACLFSGALAHVYILGKALGLRKNDHAFYRAVTRMVYGVFCFGFFFTFLGTLLGGVWANESWGRFWGWDPKENVALLIVLWQLAALHARAGGYIRHLGFNMAAVFLAMVVAFSWWGVNLLNVGLHTYGFTSGAMNALMLFWGLEAFVLALGILLWARRARTQGTGAGDAERLGE